MARLEVWKNLSSWLTAIEAAETWRDPALSGRKKKSNSEPLTSLLSSNAEMPKEARLRLADLLIRHTLKPKGNRTPSYVQSEARVDGEVLEQFVADFKKVCHYGPITRAEMDAAVEVMQRRAIAERRGRRTLDGMTAARDLREHERRSYAKYYGLNYKQFSNAIAGKSGSINRKKKANKK